MKPQTRPCYSGHSRQSGAALLMVFLFVLVLMVLGVSAMRNANQEEQVAGSLRNQQLAFQAAEEGLRYCENRLLAALPIAIQDPPGPDSGPTAFWNVDGNWNKNSAISVQAPFSFSNASPAVKDPIADYRPRCMVENMGWLYDEHNNKKPYYRITAKGWGGDQNYTVMVQSYLTINS